MTIKILLVGSFVLLALRFIANPRSAQVRASKKILGLLFIVSAIATVLYPGLMNWLAHKVGVGRGADLLLYIMSLSFVLAGFDMYLSQQNDKKRMALVVRRIALLEAGIDDLAKAKPVNGKSRKA